MGFMDFLGNADKMLPIIDAFGEVGDAMSGGQGGYSEFARERNNRRRMNKAYQGILSQAGRATPPGQITDINQTQVTPGKPALLDSQQFGLFSQLPAEIGLPMLLQRVGMGNGMGGGNFGNIIRTRDESNRVRLFQPTKQGNRPIELQFPEGVSPNPRIEKVDLGDKWGFYDTDTQQLINQVPKNLYKAASDATQGREDVLLNTEPRRAGAVRMNELAADLSGKPAVAAATKQAELAASGQPAVSAAQQRLDSKAAEELAPFITGQFADTEKNLEQMETAAAALESGKNLTGFGSGTGLDIIDALWNPEKVNVREQIEEVVQRNLRLVLGPQFTEEEGKRLIQRAFNPKLGEEVNAARARALIRSMRRGLQAKQAAADYLNANGTLRGFNGRQPSLESIEREVMSVKSGNSGGKGYALPGPLKGTPDGKIVTDTKTGQKYIVRGGRMYLQ